MEVFVPILVLAGILVFILYRRGGKTKEVIDGGIGYVRDKWPRKKLQ